MDQEVIEKKPQKQDRQPGIEAEYEVEHWRTFWVSHAHRQLSDP